MLLRETIALLSTAVLTMLLWNTNRLSVLRRLLLDSHSIAPAYAPLPLFGRPTSAQIFFLPASSSTTISGFHLACSVSLRIIERQRIDWQDCRLLVRWSLPRDIIVDVGLLNNVHHGAERRTWFEVVGVKGKRVGMRVQWNASRDVDLESPVYALFDDNDYFLLLTAEVHFEHNLWKLRTPESTRNVYGVDEVKYDATLHVPGLLIRYQRPLSSSAVLASARSPEIIVPRPTFDFVCNRSDSKVIVDIGTKGVEKMQRVVTVPVAYPAYRIGAKEAMLATLGVGLVGAMAIAMA